MYCLGDFQTMNTATNFILFNLRILGLDPLFQNRASKWLNILATSVCVLIFLPYLIEISFYFDGVQLINKFLFAPVPLQVLGVIYTFIWKREIICNLLNADKDMWPIHKFGPVMETRILAMRRRAFIIALIIYTVLICTAGMVFALYFVNDDLIFLGYRQCFPPLCRKLQFLLQLSFTIIIITSTMHTYNIFFWILILESLCQLEMLHYGIKNIKTEDLAENLKDIVDQLVNIIRFIQTAVSVYSSSLLFVFTAYPIYIIIGLFLLTQEGMTSPVLSMGKHFMIISTALFALFVFCAAGEVVKNKFELVCNAVYDIDWLHSGENQHRVGKDLVLLLQMTQNSPDITVSSLRPLNLNVFLQVVKFCYSVYTFLVAIQQ